MAVIAGALLLVVVGAWELIGRSSANHATRSSPPAPTTPSAATTSKSGIPTTAAGETTPKRLNTLVIRAVRGDCWLSVEIKASGKTVYEKTLAKGSSARFGLRKPLVVRFGAPANVRATIGRSDVSAPVLGSTAAVVVTANGVHPVG